MRGPFLGVATGLVVLAAAVGGAAARSEPAAGAPAPAAAPETPAANRVVIYGAGDPAYRSVEVDPGQRTAPEALERMLVFHDGRAILDIGLRDERNLVDVQGSNPPAVDEEVQRENAEIAADGRSAVVLSTHFRRPVVSRSLSDPLPSLAPPDGTSTLYWIDAAHPESRWTLPIESGLWVAQVVPVAAGRGVVLSTTKGIDLPADLRVIGPDGRERFRIDRGEASVTNVFVTRNGAFVAASLSYPARSGGPDSGVRVVDLLQGTSWNYAWTIGGKSEPVSWTLEETGVLAVRTPGHETLYDRNGMAIERRPWSGAR